MPGTLLRLGSWGPVLSPAVRSGLTGVSIPRSYQNTTVLSISSQAQRSGSRPFHATWKSPETHRSKIPDPTDGTVNHFAGSIHPRPGQTVGQKRFADFDLAGHVFIVTGGAQGLGLAMAEALVEAGGKVYCFDRAPEPGQAWTEAQARVNSEWGGSLQYKQQDVADTVHLDQLITSIAHENQRLDGVVAAAGIQNITPAAEYTVHDAEHMLSINYTGVLMTASAAYRQMAKYNCRGSICLIASMSGLIANKGLLCPVYNSSKAAVIQLARNLAMEWSPVRKDGTGGVRVNCISPGHVLTPMVLKNFQELPGLREEWESANMMGRLAETSEFKGAALFLLSKASSFTTGANIVIDGGHTCW